ncbi:MAG: NAD(P)/FAD-dependent oxidoreductase [Candidatus Omnitrophica bacterium]|nr:NAD(P)/FAD-dependent oxidoreductase [Candidatus Omnitrophota bacterium]
MVTKHIVVIGGGPAGMMAAIRCGQMKQRVTLLEKNSSLGKKLLLSGKGRCNITNNCELNSFLKKFSHNGEFLRDAFKTFFNTDLMKFFRERGLELKIESKGRVFPLTDKSHSALEILNRELHKNNVNIAYQSKAKNILTDNARIKSVELENSEIIPAHAIILATGGLSYSITGSTGEGLDIAKKLGHKIIALRPGLVSLEVKQNYPKALQGLTLENIRLKFSDGKRQIVSEIGDLLFTGFGISGPLVLSLSGKVTDWLTQGKGIYAEIDLQPNLSKEDIEANILRKIKIHSKKSVKNLLRNLLPSRLIDIFLADLHISMDKKVSQINQKERRLIVSSLKCFRLDIKKSRPIEEAMITCGGVSLKDVNPRTMESRLIKGLYFAGEILDIDADTGGFNLQAAFSTGYLAGQSAALN